MKTIFFVILIFISSKIHPQSSWISLSTGTSNDVTNLFFVDDNTGYAVTKANSSPFQNSIIKTSNGGVTWNSVYSQNSAGLYELQFFNSTGYIKNTGGFLKTTNAGLNWVQFSLPSGITSICFIDSSFGYGIGNFMNTVKTTDGGATWVSVSSSSGAVYNISPLFFLNSLTGFGAGYTNFPEVGTYSTLITTTNGGVNWSSSSPGGSGGNSSFGNFNKDTIFCFTSTYEFGTTNAGSTWSYHHFGTLWQVNAFFRINSTTAFLNSQNLNGNLTPGLWKTTNKGVSWSQSNYTPSIPLLDIFFSSELTGYICGSFGGIYKTTTGGIVTGFTQTSSQLPNNFSLLQNYPNPFNPLTRINYELPITNYVTIKIYDALGNLVETLVNEKQNAGSYSVDFNASSLPSGIYFYKLVTEIFSETKKMVLVK